MITIGQISHDGLNHFQLYLTELGGPLRFEISECAENISLDGFISRCKEKYPGVTLSIHQSAITSLKG